MKIKKSQRDIFLHRIKARTSLERIQVPMPYNNCSWQDGPQLSKQRQHGSFLFQRPCVRGNTVGRQASFVTDTHRMSVVILAMRAHLLYRSAKVDLTITGDVKMVTDIFEATMMNMIMAASLEIQVPPLRGGGTMDNDKCYFTHTGPPKCSFVFL